MDWFLGESYIKRCVACLFLSRASSTIDSAVLSPGKGDEIGGFFSPWPSERETLIYDYGNNWTGAQKRNMETNSESSTNQKEMMRRDVRNVEGRKVKVSIFHLKIFEKKNKKTIK